jgi:carboxymethylenebutenolidase
MADSNGVNGHNNGANGTTSSPPPLPAVHLTSPSPDLSLLSPLSRKGSGPGLLLIPHFSQKPSQQTSIIKGVPSPLIKWAEEGYTVASIPASSLTTTTGIDVLHSAIAALARHPKCTTADKLGLIIYDERAYNAIAAHLSAIPAIVGVIVYSSSTTSPTLSLSPIPSVRHLAGKSATKQPLPRTKELTSYAYEHATPNFAVPFQDSWDYSAESISHTRNLQFLKPLVDGPWFDLEAIWEEHTFYEFGERSVENTMVRFYGPLVSFVSFSSSAPPYHSLITGNDVSAKAPKRRAMNGWLIPDS